MTALYLASLAVGIFGAASLKTVPKNIETVSTAVIALIMILFSAALLFV